MSNEKYLSLKEAADFFGIGYYALCARIRRNPNDYKVNREISPHGGRPRIYVAVSSLKADNIKIAKYKYFTKSQRKVYSKFMINSMLTWLENEVDNFKVAYPNISEHEMAMAVLNAMKNLEFDLIEEVFRVKGHEVFQKCKLNINKGGLKP